jgi:DNA polymerase-3 subunit gamma/tau
LIHTFQKEGRNLQHFCREAIRHMRNLLIAKVCGADSDLIAATPDQRPALAQAAAHFSEEDLTRFFQILLQTDDDLRRKPDPRVHLEMGLLRLINAARLAPLEELLTEIKSGATGGGTPGGTGGPSTSTPARRAASASASGTSFAAPTNTRFAATIAPAMALPNVKPHFAPVSTPEIKPVPAAPPLASVAAPAPPPAIVTEQIPVETISPAATNGAPSTNGTTESHAEKENAAPTSASNLRLDGITAQQVREIKSAVEQQQKFLSGLLEHAIAWELTGAELKLFYTPDKKWCAEMLEGRDSLEKLRGVSSKVLGRPIRVCAKLEVGSNPAATSRAGSDMQELRARFEGDPMVRSLMQRFGGKISEVRRAPEE